ncbi:uncharacterized protein LOC134248158 isoform X2 [Saccostrea cucullata]|uniref:uncharacterized protein LOC134248158 isoform X2 n=1 Tax=Saccostrea cuccullata TaxID=36930 RepID=UPI002ED1959B
MKETEETETYISKFTMGEAKMDQKISKLEENFENLEIEGENLRKIWHEEIDIIFNTLQSTIRTMKDKRVRTLKSHQSLLQNSGSNLELIVKENKKILKSNKVTDITSHRSKLKEFRKIPTDVDVTIPALKSNTVKGSEFSIELAEYKATLKQTPISNLTDEFSVLSVRKLLDKAKVINSIPSGINPLRSVICIGSNEAWVHGKDTTLRCIDIQGSVTDMVNTKCDPSPSDLSVTRQGELIFSDVHTTTVNIVRQGRIETLIIMPQGWLPFGLSCTRSGDILVCMCTTDQGRYKIVRFQGPMPTHEIEKDEYGQQIIKGGELGAHVVENNNGDICVCDMDAKTVIVVDKTGRVRFRYDGTSAKRIIPFQPGNIALEPLSHIIISDVNNNCLHILDQNGQFLKCVDNSSIDRPCGLSVDSEGRLWVGSFDTGVVKVIQYME